VSAIKEQTDDRDRRYAYRVVQRLGSSEERPHEDEERRHEARHSRRYRFVCCICAPGVYAPSDFHPVSQRLEGIGMTQLGNDTMPSMNTTARRVFDRLVA